MRTRTQPFLGALLLVVTSAPSVLAAPAPFEPTPAFDLQLSFPDPGKTADRLRGAVASLQRGDTTRAMSEARAVLQDDPGSASAHEVIGSVAMLKGDWAEAERPLNEAVRLNPRSDTALTKLGGTLLAMKKSTQAAELFRKALAISPSKGTARRNLAVIEIQQGRISQAIAGLQESLQASKGPDRLTKYFLTSLYLTMLQPDEAERVAADMVKTEADWPSAHFLMGIVKLDQGKVSDALPLLQKALPQVSRGAWTQLTTAVTHRTTGNLTESLRLLEQVTKDKRDWTLGQFELGQTLSALKQFDRAQQAYKLARRTTTGLNVSFLAGIAETYAWQAQRPADVVAQPRMKAAK